MESSINQGKRVSETMHIAMCANEAYLPYVAVTLKSIVDKHKGKDICLHVLTDRVSPRNKRRLKKIVQGSSIGVEIHIVDDTLLHRLPLSKFTIYAWYRILLPTLLPESIDRVLYIDCDTLVCDDLSALWDIDLLGISTAAVPDDQTFNPEHYERCGIDSREGYFCSGVLMINLDYWRVEGITDKLIDWATSHADMVVYPDQDALNVVCRTSAMMLPLRYGITPNVLLDPRFEQQMYQQVVQCKEHPAIVHYCRIAPWYYECDHPMAHLWRSMNRRLGFWQAPMSFKYPTKGIEALKTRLWHLFH